MLSTNYKSCLRLSKTINHTVGRLSHRLKQGLKLGLLTIGLSTLVACGGGDDEKSDVIRVGVAMPNYGDTFMVYLRDSMEKYAEEKYGDKFEMVFVDGKEDAVTQLGQIKNFIVQNMDAIIIVPVDTEATQPMTDDIIKAGIELVYLNRRPAYLPDSIYYVGSEELKFGETQAQYVADTRDGGNIAILMGMLSQEAAILRTQGVEDFFKDKPNFQITRKQTGLWQRSQGMTVSENWLNTSEIPDIIISNNDDMALGAIQALRAAGKLETTMVVGIDATPDGLMAVKKGEMDATVFQDGRSQAKSVVDNVVDAVKGVEHKKITWVPAELVTQDTLAAFEAKQAE